MFSSGRRAFAFGYSERPIERPRQNAGWLVVGQGAADLPRLYFGAEYGII